MSVFIKHFFTIIILLTAVPEPVEEIISVNTLQKSLEQLANESDLKNAGLGVLVVDLENNKTIASINPDLSLEPASVQKLITTATAIEIFGDKYRYETRIEYSGTIHTSGTLKGNIFILGSGDPTLGSERFPTRNGFIKKWVEAIRLAGIKKIQGQIIADAQIYSTNILPRKRIWEDMANYYGSGACGLSIFDNQYFVTFKSGYRDGDDTEIIKVEPHIPGLSFDNRVKASNINRDQAYIFGAPYTYQRSILGTIPKGKSEFTIKGAIPDPPHFAAMQLDKALNNAGIMTTLPPTTIRRLKQRDNYLQQERKKLFTTYSPTMREIINKTNKISINLYAEHLTAHIGLDKRVEGNTESGLDATKLFWAKRGMDTKGLFIHDGSGLTDYNAVSARHFVFLLQYMKNKGRYFNAFYESLPVAGKSGTLRYMCRGTRAQNNVRAKSGSIEKVRCYAGYVTTRNGKELAFAMLSNHYNCTDYEMREKWEDVMVKMANLNL